MKKIFSVLMAVIIFSMVTFNVYARENQVKNSSLSVDGELNAYFYADELIENGSLLLYKDKLTGYTATIEIDDTYPADDYHTAKIHFKDGNAYVEFYITFNTTTNTIIAANRFLADLPHRNNVNMDSERNLAVEKTDYGTRASICYSAETDIAFAEQSCDIELRDNGLLYIRRFVLDSHIKGGYDGLTLKTMIYKHINYIKFLPLIIILIPVIIKYKNKKVSV